MCENCTDGLKLSTGNECVKSIGNCKTLSDLGTCLECLSGFSMTFDRMNCEQNQDGFHCLQHFFDSINIKNKICLVAEPGYLIDPNGGSPTPSVPGCSSYEKIFICYSCTNPEFSPNMNRTKCLKRPDYCLIPLNELKCFKCLDGYNLIDDSCVLDERCKVIDSLDSKCKEC
jgi:hypothetical protein